MFKSVSEELDLDVVLVDGTFVKVHQHGTGAPKEDSHPTNPKAFRRLDAAVVG